MAIQTTLKQSFILWNTLYLVITAGLGIWGAYDYWVTIPNQAFLAAEFESLSNEGHALKELVDENQTLNSEQIARYEEIQNTLAAPPFENTPPQAPASYDRPLNFWVYFIGCGVLSAPWFLWKLLTKKRAGPKLEDDGSLVCAKASFSREQILGINMSKWMSKSTARVEIHDQNDPILLDDYVYQNTYLLVGALANRFHPGEWTEEAKPVKTEEEVTSETVTQSDAGIETDTNAEAASDHGTADGNETHHSA